jgi:hypothetical protein
MEQQVAQLKSAANEIRSAAQDRFVGSVVASAMQIGSGLVQIGSGAMAASQASKALSAKDPSIKANQQEIASLSKDAKELASYTPKELEAMSKNPAISSSDLAQKAMDSRMKAELNTKIGDLKAQNVEAQTKLDNLKADLNRKASLTQEIGKGSGNVLEGIGGIAKSSMELKASAHDAARSDLEAQAKISEVNSQQAGDFMQQMMDMIRDVRDKLSSIEQSNIETNRGIARNI